MVAAEEALRAGRPEEARAHAVVARDLATRSLLPGIESFWWSAHRESLRACLVRALEALSESASSCGDASLAISIAEQAVTLEPYRASAHRHLMHAHIAGNRAEALRAYERCRRLLAEELGVAPSAETEAAYVALLGPEPAPAPVAGSPPASTATPQLAAALPVAQPFPFVGRQAERELLDDA